MAKKIDKQKLAEAIEGKMAKKVKKFTPNPNDDPRPGVANPVLPHGPTPVSTGGGVISTVRPADDGDGPHLNLPPGVKDPLGPRIKEEFSHVVHPLNEAIRKPSAVLKGVAAGKVNTVAKGVKTKKK